MGMTANRFGGSCGALLLWRVNALMSGLMGLRVVISTFVKKKKTFTIKTQNDHN